MQKSFPLFGPICARMLVSNRFNGWGCCVCPRFLLVVWRHLDGIVTLVDAKHLIMHLDEAGGNWHR